MRLFVIDVDKQEHDRVSSVAVFAENKERAIEIAVEYDNIFENNIESIAEISVDSEGVVHSYVL